MTYVTTEGFPCVAEGDCLEVMRGMPDNYVDSVICDPPAGISFMSKKWDSDKGGMEAWVDWLAEVMREALRVSKPGATALVWALPRTSHWTGLALERAGWQVRDRITHMFGTGFPKSLDVSKAIDKAAGAEREVVGNRWGSRDSEKMLGVVNDDGWTPSGSKITTPATDAAQLWQGWGTALKPAAEDWWLCMKPLDGTFAANALEHGVAGLNVDGCRVEGPPSGLQPYERKVEQRKSQAANHKSVSFTDHSAGRWPTNLLLSHSPDCTEQECVEDCAARMLDEQSGERKSGRLTGKQQLDGGFKGSKSCYGTAGELVTTKEYEANSGGASRFFPRFNYCAKAAKRERWVHVACACGGRAVPAKNAPKRGDECADCGEPMKVEGHATVKPLSLMRWLVRLTKTPTGGIVLDPFAGSFSTGEACLLEGRRFVGIEREHEYAEIGRARLAAVVKELEAQRCDS